MKKFFKVLFACLLALFIVFFFRQHNIKLNNIISPFQNLSNKSDFVYTNNFKVNKLQPTVADYYFSQLNDSQKLIYSSIALGVSKYEKTISIKNYKVTDDTTSYNDVSDAIEAFFEDHPEVFYLDFKYQLNSIKSPLGNRLEVLVSYTDDANTIKQQISNVDDTIRDMTSDLTNLNEFDKELNIHDRLGQSTVYYNYVSDDSIPQCCHTSYGALIDKKAVCDGFTKALQLLLDRENIQTIFVSGKTDNKAHAWDLVKIDNNWYHLDLTSDKLVKQTDGTTPNVIHTYFNITDNQITATHSIDQKYKLPQAVSNDANYYIVTQNYIYGTNDFTSKLKEIVDKQKSNKVLEFACDNISDVPSKMTKTLYDMNFNNAQKTRGQYQIQYYNVLNTYIIEK